MASKTQLIVAQRDAILNIVNSYLYTARGIEELEEEIDNILENPEEVWENERSQHSKKESK